MNTLKIEQGAILVLKQAVFQHDLMKDYINDNDKEPSWDGHIYLYKNDDLKVENIIHRIPVQVKGKNDEKLLKRSGFTYPVEYKHLRNYHRDGGIFYIVIVISDDKSKTAIFYNALTSVKLESLLKGNEKKKDDQTKSIPLQRLKKNDYKMLYKLLRQFGYDREKQGSGNSEIVKKAISLSDMKFVDSIKVTSYIGNSEIEVMKAISSGEISLYGHRSDLDMWLPFEYKHQKDMVFKKILPLDKKIGIDGIYYYDSYQVEEIQTNKGDSVLRFSENLTMNLEKGKLNFEANGPIDSIMKDIAFVKAIQTGTSLYVDEKKVCDFNKVTLSKQLMEKIEILTDIHKAFKEIDFKCNKKLSEFTEKNWIQIGKLLKVYRREIVVSGEENNSWYMWEWDNKSIPLLLKREDDGTNVVMNWMAQKDIELFVDVNNKQHILPKFIVFKREILEKIYDYDEALWMDEVAKIGNSTMIIDILHLYLMEVIYVYDKTENELFYRIANALVDKVLLDNPNDEYGILNKMQLIRRKRELEEEELQKLEKIESITDDPLAKCAVNILVGNKRKAKLLVEELTDEQQNTFKNYPIYSLL